MLSILGLLGSGGPGGGHGGVVLEEALEADFGFVAWFAASSVAGADKVCLLLGAEVEDVVGGTTSDAPLFEPRWVDRWLPGALLPLASVALSGVRSAAGFALALVKGSAEGGRCSSAS